MIAKRAPVLRVGIAVAVSLLITGAALGAVAARPSHDKVRVIDYSTRYVDRFEGNVIRPPGQATELWLEYEANRQRYFDEIYWADVKSGNSMDVRRGAITDALPFLNARLDRIEYLSKHIKDYSKDALNFISKHFPCDHTIRIYLAISPTRIDAKTQWYGDDHHAIHINAYHNSLLSDDNVRIILSHELCHELFSQHLVAKGENIDYQSVWGRLISEGIATYVSGLYTVEATPSEILFMSDDDYGKTKRILRGIAKDIIAVYESTDESDVADIFGYGNKEYPPRCGYYVGRLVAERLAGRYSFQGLIGMSLNELKAAFRDELSAVAGLKNSRE